MSEALTLNHDDLLDATGLKLVGGRLLPGPNGPASFLMYETASLENFSVKVGDKQAFQMTNFEAEVTPPADGKAMEFIGNFTPTLLHTVCEPDIKDNIRSVVIEGHTDSDRPADKPFYNLELSQRRALAVLTAMLQTDDYVGRECLLDVASASGRGERDVIKVDGIEDKDKSRRVVFKINMKSQQEEQFENLLKNATPYADIRRETPRPKTE